MPLVSFQTPWNKCFLMFSGGIERDQWHAIGKFGPKNPNSDFFLIHFTMTLQLLRSFIGDNRIILEAFQNRVKKLGPVFIVETLHDNLGENGLNSNANLGILHSKCQFCKILFFTFWIWFFVITFLLLL